MDSRTSKATGNHCALCCEQVQIFAIGKCDHPVCYKCSTKMRVLCGQRDCAFCKEELNKVVFVEKLEAFSCLPYQQFHCEKKHDIYISSKNIYLQYRRLLVLECLHCSEHKAFSSFEELQEHMMRQHKLLCCKLCRAHLKIFPHEQKWYDFKQLAYHYAYGDPGDPSHRGHPLCKICNHRHFDKNQLLNHLHKDHFCCPFCDVDHCMKYYSDAENLRQHFRDSHYLCEEDHCASLQVSHVFRSEIDYQAHKIAAHSKSWTEAQRDHQLNLYYNHILREQGRNEGLITRRKYKEMYQSQSLRGRPYWPEKSRRNTRENEDRQAATPMRARMACPVSKEDALPSHSGVAVASHVTPSCSAQLKTNPLSFQEGIPAHESKIPQRTAAGFNSALSNKAKTPPPPPPPPGFKSPFPMKSSIRPPPPPGLGIPATTKPPPGFTGTPLSSNVAGPASVVNRCPEVSSNVFFVPEDFKQRSLALIISIIKYLDNDESKFNEFKQCSSQFRQDVISAAQYHRRCKELLGENFNNIFKELLTLLPNTTKQHELLTAYKDSRAVEKQSVAGGARENKYKNACQTTTTNVAHAAPECDRQVCPTCKRELDSKDLTKQDKKNQDIVVIDLCD